MFGTFAGCCNSHLVALDQYRETSFLFGAVSTCWEFFFSLLFLQVSFLQSCVLHYFVLVVVLVFLDVW